MDPVNVGMQVSEHNEHQIYNFFEEIAKSPEELEEMHTQFNLYNQSLAPFDSSGPHPALCWKYKMNARQFWVAFLTRANALARLGNRIFQCPANSVPCERAFSTQNFIHSKMRNHLKPDHVDKLTYIYMNRRALRLKGQKHRDDVEVNYLDLSTLTAEEEVELEDKLLHEEDDEEYGEEY